MIGPRAELGISSATLPWRMRYRRLASWPCWRIVSPAPKRTLEAHPTSNWMYSGRQPFRRGCSSRTRSRVCGAQTLSSCPTSPASPLNFPRAAEELYISQPAVSKHVKDLEKDLGIDLFRRNGRRVELTDAGRLVYDYAGPALVLH